MPIVSIIVPNYNHAPYIKQRIDSILTQTYQDFELILLDDYSTDGSREVIEQYRSDPHVSKIIYNEVNSGSAFRQWDKGISLANGKWIWVAESDDYCEPTFLERLLAEATKIPNCSLAFTATWWVDENGKKLWNNGKGDCVQIHNSQDFIHHRLATNCPIANVSECIFRRDKFRPTETYRYEHMRLCGDWFFYLLLAQQGSIVELEEPLNYYRQHSTNISNDAEHQGLTFLEGANILDYMVDNCGLKTSNYARGWGKMWAQYQKKYKFSSSVQKKVRRRLSNVCLIIYPYYLLYKLKYLCV